MKMLAMAMILVAVSLPCASAPFVKDLAPTADALLWSMDASHNYGKGGALSLFGSDAKDATGDPMGVMDSLMRFDTSGFVALADAFFGPEPWTITSAVLRLNEQTQPNNPIYYVAKGLFEVEWIADDAWLEGTGTPKTPSTDGVTFSDEASILALGAQSLGTFESNGMTTDPELIDVFCALGLPSDFVADIMTMAGGDVSLFLTAANDAVGFQFAARDNKDTTSRPYLTLTAGPAAGSVPEPATACLLAIGLLGCVRRQRRRPCGRGPETDSR